MLIHADFQDNKKESTYNRFRPITDKLNKQQKVEFALYCAKDVLHFTTNQTRESAELCISLVEKWLNDNSSVTQEELRNAANAVWASANASVAAADAARAARAAGAAAAAAAYAAAAYASAAYASAAYASVAAAAAAAANAANAAAAAAANAANAANADVREHKIFEYIIIANSFFTTTNQTQPFLELDQKIIYLIDELDENLIIKHEDLYFLNMNGITRCHHLGCKSQGELIEKVLYGDEAFYWFARRYLNRLYP